MMEKIITLKPASDADDLNCPDGEIMNYYSDLSQSGSYSLKFEPEAAVPDGADFLALHSLPDGPVNAIFLLDGKVRFLSLGEGNSSLTPIEGVTSPQKVVGSGLTLVFLTDGRLLFSLWNGSGYEAAVEAPSAPNADIAAKASALPPYSYSAIELPKLSIQTGTGSDLAADVVGWLAGTGGIPSLSTRIGILEGVKAALKTFLAEVRSAGLHFSPVLAAVCRRLPDGTLYAATAPSLLPDLPPLTLRITEQPVCADGTLYLTLTLSRSPFRLEIESEESDLQLLVSSNATDISAEALSTPVFLGNSERGFTVGGRTISERDFTPLPAVSTPMTEASDIFSIGGRLYGVQSNPHGDSILISRPGLPFACGGSTLLPAVKILYLTNSLRSVSAQQGGAIPLYAFCADGIRYLTPVGDEVRDVRLISRDVAVSKDCFAPLPDGTAFISESGVKKISGTAVSMTDYVEIDADSDSLLYLYKENKIVKGTAGGEKPATFHYAWPDVYSHIKGEGLGSLSLARREMTAEPSETAPRPITTRPIKLGSPFSLKKLVEVEAQWPDGSCWPVKVYGALLPGKWRFLGLARKGRMLMRGSGWRFFRIETFGRPTFILHYNEEGREIK